MFWSTVSVSFLPDFLRDSELSKACSPILYTPILNRRDPKQPNNYGLISLLSVFAKLLEKIMKIRFIRVFEQVQLRIVAQNILPQLCRVPFHIISTHKNRSTLGLHQDKERD